MNYSILIFLIFTYFFSSLITQINIYKHTVKLQADNHKPFPQVSNILFLVGPPFLIYLFKDYGRFIQPAIHMIWILLIVVGLSSAYFHATLSLLGQLLDELTILWVFMATLSLFCPRRHFPRVFKHSR